MRSAEITRAGDRGSATVLVVGAIGVVVMLLAGAMALVSAQLASHRARAAADLAALAGAHVLLDAGDGRDPCGVAAAVAQHNNSWIVKCAVTGQELTLTAASRASWPGLGAARARARAGPQSPTSSHSSS